MNGNQLTSKMAAMTLVQLLFICLGVNFSAAYVRRVPVEERIIGGSPATIEEFPYLVSIRVSIQLGQFTYHYCGGSIISANWVLSAGQCTSALQAKHVHVYAGSKDRLVGGILYNVSQIIPHPQYYISADGTSMNDIGLIKVATPIVFSSKVNPIKLPTASTNTEVVTGTKATVAGWGATPQSNFKPVVSLLKVSIFIVSQEDCERIYNSTELISKTVLCAGTEKGGNVICQGDFGGALLADGVLVGVASWGIECGVPSNPGVYTNVSSFRSWISSNTGV